MDYQKSVQELPNTERRITELFDPNSYYELPASPHHECVELAGDNLMPRNPLKRSPHTTRKALREYHLGPITTPSLIPIYSPEKYSQDTPGMTYEDISSVSPSQSPLTPSTNAIPSTRQQSRLSASISSLTEREMPLPVIRQNVEATGFQNLAPLLYQPSSHVQAGLNQRETSDWYHGYNPDPRVFSIDNDQYYSMNAGQETWPVAGTSRGDNISRRVPPAMPAVWQTGKSFSTVCMTCGAVFHGRYCKGNKKRHIKTKHDSNQPTIDRTCSFCHRVFNRGDAARKHERNAHKSELLNLTKKRK